MKCPYWLRCLSPKSLYFSVKRRAEKGCQVFGNGAEARCVGRFLAFQRRCIVRVAWHMVGSWTKPRCGALLVTRKRLRT